MKKRISVLLICVMLAAVLAGCGCDHEWTEANCYDPKTCALCGETEGEDLGHDYLDASCEAPKTCSRCGKEKGEALGHTWVEADCLNAKTCSVCGATEGEALGHELPTGVECESDTLCLNCGEVMAAATGHSWSEADCLNAAFCENCGATGDAALGHDWIDATYEAPKTCSRCGKTEGEPLVPEVVVPANLGVSLDTYVEQMNGGLATLGYGLVYVVDDEYGDPIYAVYNLATADVYEVFTCFYLDTDGTTVYAVMSVTEQGADNAMSELCGNCFGIAAVIADNTFGDEDLAALVSNGTTQADGSQYYTLEKNGLSYMMAFTFTDAGGLQVTTLVAPME